MGKLATTLLVLTLCACRWEPPPLTPEEQAEVQRNLLDSVPDMDHEVHADMGGEVTYLGLDASPSPVRPGKELTLVHYFRVDDILFDWDLFVHLHPRGSQRFNGDHVPVSGLHPIARWKKGQIIRDAHTVEVPDDVREEIQVLVGLYRGPGRIEVLSGPSLPDDRVVAAVLPVEP